MNTKNHYFGQVLDEADLDQEFTDVETHVDTGRLEPTEGVAVEGITVGLEVSSYAAADNTFQVSAGSAIGNTGRRVFTRDGGVLGNNRQTYATDSDGNSTDPGPGNYRWVTVAIRFGKSLLDPQTDDLGNTVYANTPDSWNGDGLDFFDDATKAQNDAKDGGLDFDTNGFSSVGFYVAAGAAALINDPLTFPAIPADAIILADILYIDGDQALPLDDSRISKVRQQAARKITFRPELYDATPHFKQLWKIFGDDYSTRFYQGAKGLVITINCAHLGISTGAAEWSSDVDVYPSIKIEFSSQGLVMYQKDDGDNTTPWQDSNWTRQSFYSPTGDAIGDSDLTGYVAFTQVNATSAIPIRMGAPFSRQFLNTPSSVTFGAGGPDEDGVGMGSLVAAHIGKYGFDVVATTDDDGSNMVVQREYTVSL